MKILSKKFIGKFTVTTMMLSTIMSPLEIFAQELETDNSTDIVTIVENEFGILEDISFDVQDTEELEFLYNYQESENERDDVIEDELEDYLVINEDGTLFLDSEKYTGGEITAEEIDKVQENLFIVNDLVTGGDAVIDDEFNVHIPELDESFAAQSGIKLIQIKWTSSTYKVWSNVLIGLGITGMIYHLYSMISGSLDFSKLITQGVTGAIATAAGIIGSVMFVLPTYGVSQVVAHYLSGLAEEIATAFITLNLLIMTGGIFAKLTKLVLNIVASRLAPTLIASIDMIYSGMSNIKYKVDIKHLKFKAYYSRW